LPVCLTDPEKPFAERGQVRPGTPLCQPRDPRAADSPRVSEQEPTVKAEEVFELGVKYLDKEDLDNALVAFSQAIRLDPEFAQAYNGRAVALALKEETEKALADCCEAIRLDANDPEFYRSRGFVYELMGDDEKAAGDFAKAQELDGAG
jgi:tetratricopeptide (TPR) repeat protein